MSPERTGFLYPFLEAEERDHAGLLRDLAASAAAKTAESDELRRATLARLDADLDAAAVAMAGRFAAGGHLLAFGNGGSSTDAAGLAACFLTAPEDAPGRSLPARSLAEDPAVLTALGNDVGFDVVFARQLAAFGGDRDIAVGLSTSGSSENLLQAFAVARKRGMLTIGLAGGDGGRMAAADIDHCFVVRATSIHRIQETQAAVGAELWARTHRSLASGDPRRGNRT
ncbi:MAG TPA: SIS domain-containing protein [Acidimicrobiales bacterium]|nr:SIS domain-containing protein [Acidimicrobiales bacterium]